MSVAIGVFLATPGIGFWIAVLFLLPSDLGGRRLESVLYKILELFCLEWAFCFWLLFLARLPRRWSLLIFWINLTPLTFFSFAWFLG